MGSTRCMVSGRRPALLVALAVVLFGAAFAPLAPAGGALVAAAGGSARIAHSADGVHLRREPTYGAEVIGTLAEGSVVTLRTDEVDTIYDPDGTTRWWPVATDAGDGWVAGFFLRLVGLADEPAAPADVVANADADGVGSLAADPPPAAVPQGGSTDGLHLGGGTARVAEPDGVNVRSAPGLGSDSIAALRLDTVVELRIDEADTVYVDGGRWWPVRIDGRDGWVIGTYLAPHDGGTAPAGDAPAAPAIAGDVPGKQGPLFAPGSYVAAITNDGSGLNIRADGAPDAERIGAIPERDVVQVMDGPFLDPTGTGWYLITDGGVSGFVDGNWLVEAGQPPSPDGDDGPALQFPEAPQLNLAGLATGSFRYPADNLTLTQGYGCSPYWWFYPWEPGLGCHVHNAVDLAAPYYTPLYAADGGIVEYAGWCDCGLGYYVKIDHQNGFKTTYGHMAEQPWVSTGQAVQKGEVIGPMGSTGLSTGSHVHFMLELNGATVDPLGYLP